MSILPDRLQALKEGRVIFRIYLNDECIYENTNIIAGAIYADELKKENPKTKYDIRLDEIAK